LLKAIARRYVMADPARLAIQRREQHLLSELVLAIADRGSEALDPMFVASYDSASGDAERIRVVLDQVSLLTDAQAVARHRRLTGGATLHP
jgi:dGTPase